MPEDVPASSDRTTDPVAARLGTVLAGKWTLEQLLGAGAMAAVYVGRHKIGRRDAIKILHPEIAADEQLAARFEQEAHAVNCLDHPGAVEIRDIGETAEGEPYLVMELLEGQSLADRLEAGPLEQPEALRLVDELLDVLVAAHGAQIIHRDIKPDNLFLLDDGRLKVLDFGIARVRRAGSMKVVTQLGAALGTPAYMPQEQIKGMDVDHRADLFAVGAVLFELLTRRRVHQGDNPQMLMVKMLTCPAPALATVASELPAELCAVVDRALAFEAADRYPDAATMQADVRALREGRAPPLVSQPAVEARTQATVLDAPGSLAGAATATSPTAGDRARREPTLVLLAIAAAAGLALGVLVVLWAASTTARDEDESSLDASAPPASGAGDADAGQLESDPSADVPATSSEPTPSSTATPAHEAPRRSKALERARKKRDKELKRESKRRAKGRRKKR